MRSLAAPRRDHHFIKPKSTPDDPLAQKMEGMSTRAAPASHVDYVVAGGGYAGLNAVAALRRAKPEASVLCIDKHARPGGSWNDFYSYATLHLPHPTFGVNGHPWHLEDPNALASRDDVLHHFQTFVDGLPRSHFEFRGNTELVSAQREINGLNVNHSTPSSSNDSTSSSATCQQPFSVQLRSGNGGTYEVSASNFIDAFAFDFKGYCQASEDALSDGSTCKREVETRDLPEMVRKGSKDDRLYVVIGGGKTGLDTAAWLGAHKAADDEVMMVTGRSKTFWNRRNMAPRKELITPQTPTSGELLLDMVLQYDGTNGGEILEACQHAGFALKVGGDRSVSTYGAFLSPEELQHIQASCSEIRENDYFVGYDEAGESGHTHRIRFKSGRPVETKKEVVLVNCRASNKNHENSFFSTRHPLGADGTLRFGSALFGTTGPSTYLTTLLHARDPQALQEVELYGFKHQFRMEEKPGADQFFQHGLLSMVNFLALAERIEEHHGDHPEFNDDLASFNLDWNTWFPQERRSWLLRRLQTDRMRLRDKAQAFLRRLSPGDEQPR